MTGDYYDPFEDIPDEVVPDVPFEDTVPMEVPVKPEVFEEDEKRMRDMQECLDFFNQVDAILEPDIENYVATFISCGGRPDQMIPAFTNNFKGYSQLGNIAISWLEGFGISANDIELLVMEQIKDKMAEEIGRNRANNIFESLKVDLSEGKGDQSRPDVVSFDKFSNSIRNSLLTLLNSSNRAAFDENLVNFCRTACISELSYYKTRRMLHKLHQERDDLLLKNIISQLEKYSKQRAPTTGLDIAAMRLTKNQQVRAILEDLATSGTATTTDISRIIRMTPENISHLQSEELFDFLVNYVFVPQEQSIPRRQLKSYVSALASLSHGRSMEKNPRLIDSLLHLATLCQTKQFGSHIIPVPNWLLTGLSDPLFCRGLVRWIHHVLSSVSYFRTTYEQTVTPLFITLLGHIATQHELLRNPIFEIVLTMLTLRFPKEFLALEVIELQKKLLPLLTHLIHLGLGNIIFTYLHNNIDCVDRSILRELLIMVCDSIRPPVPDQFVEAFGKLLKKSIDWIKQHDATFKSVDSFIHSLPSRQRMRFEQENMI